MKFLPPQTLGGFGAFGYKVGFHPCRAKNFTDEFTRERVIVHDKDLGRQRKAPVANGIRLRLRYASKVKNLFALFSNPVGSGLVLLEAVESRLVLRGRLCSPPAGSLPAPSLGHVPSPQSRGFRPVP